MIERKILGQLISNEQYARAVIPFLKPSYFEEQGDKEVFKRVVMYIDKYNDLPTVPTLEVELDQAEIDQSVYEHALAVVKTVNTTDNVDVQWMIDQTEKFCQDRALYNAIRKSIAILDGDERNVDKGALPQMLADALSVSFDKRIGHDFLDEPEWRYDAYTRVEDRLAFDIDLMNKATRGGLPKKSLSVILAGTGVGKTFVMCHMAASHMLAGHKVLYLTAEMAEERIAERIDANILGINLDQLTELDRDTFAKRINRIKGKTPGRLIIKEYPTASTNSNHIRHLLNELKIKKNFIPDVIYIDYINIFASSRVKHDAGGGSYGYVKAIAEEFRGLAIEFETRIVTATQTNRSGYSHTDIDLTETAESFGLPQTADFFLALMSTEELESLNQMMFKVLKNRWGDVNKYRRFVVGIDRAQMRLYDAEDSAQLDGTVEDDVSVFDHGAVGQRQEDERRSGMPSKFNKKQLWDNFR